MKTSKNKTKKILAGLVAFILIGSILFFAIAFVGNPISKMLANRGGQKLVEEKYDNLDLNIEKAFYNFKDGNYIVRLRSNKSIDTHFELSFTPSGKLHYDNYQDAVASKWNTRMRLEDQYRKLTGQVFEDDFPYKTSIDYGEILAKDEDFSYLELDKIYDIKEIGKEEGHLNLYIETKDQDRDTMVKVLLETKKIFDRKDVPFYSVDLTLEKPKRENENYEEGLMIKDFLYEDIYLEGLAKRVDENIEVTKKYWEDEQKRKDREFEELDKKQEDEK